MRKSNLLLTFLVVILLGCNKHDIKKNFKSCNNDSNAQSIVHDDIIREYLIHVPDSYDEGSAVPLMINFHGFGETASDYMKNADMRIIADYNNFILVYPQGSCFDGSSHWNPCPIGDGNKSTADDLGFIQAIIYEISSNYNIARDRIYAVGYSNGGMMAYGLANHKSDLVAGIACVSGAMLDCVGPTSHPMPILHIHGTSDNDIPYGGSDEYISVQNTLDYWIDFNNTSKNPIVEIDNSGATNIEHYTYNKGDNSVSVEHYKYIEGDHVWFNSTYQGMNTSELVWKFLSKFNINGKI